MPHHGRPVLCRSGSAGGSQVRRRAAPPGHEARAHADGHSGSRRPCPLAARPRGRCTCPAHGDAG
eukprot:6496782-Alexandrium_andersonii.AAC.1